MRFAVCLLVAACTRALCGPAGGAALVPCTFSKGRGTCQLSLRAAWHRVMRIVARSLVEARVRTSVDGRLDGAVRPRVRRALRAACCGKRQAPVDGRLDCVAGIRVMRVSCARSLGRESGFGRWTPGYRRSVQYLGSGHMNERNLQGYAHHFSAGISAGCLGSDQWQVSMTSSLLATFG